LKGSNRHVQVFSTIVILRPEAEESKSMILRSAQDDGNLHMA
jgi:hypothetical protein